MKTYLLPLVICMALAARIDAGVVLDESFSYSDGFLTNVSGNAWISYSGPVGEVEVSAGKMVISQSETEGVARPIPGGPYPDALYASFVVNFSTAPAVGAAGTYFASFKDNGTVNRCRVFATTSGAASGMFRVGIANGGSTFVAIPRDLSLRTDYLLVVRYNTNSGANASTLWINPASEGATSDRALAVDNQTASPATTFGFRQSNLNGGMGILTVDDLKIGTTFSDVVVVGGNYSLTIAGTGTDVQVSWPVAAVGYFLQFTGELGTGWTDSTDPVSVEGDQKVVRYLGTTGRRCFRLKKP